MTEHPVRTDPAPGDREAITRLHAEVYAREYGFDESFGRYVEEPLTSFLAGLGPRERLWVAERDGEMLGCIAIQCAAPETAQVRWFIVSPEARGAGLGRRLLETAVEFSREQGYERIVLWTVSALGAAIRLYTDAGFRKVEEERRVTWSVDVTHEQYELTLR